MNELVTELIKRLRSRDYIQAFRRLKCVELDDASGEPIKFGHCCLGVAGEIAVERQMARWERHGSVYALIPVYAYPQDEDNTVLLPTSISDAFGWQRGEQTYYASLNDRMFTHVEIADMMEERELIKERVVTDATDRVQDTPPA